MCVKKKKNTHFSEVEESECSIKSGSPTIRLEQKVVFDWIDLILFILFEKIGSQTLTIGIQSLTG